MDVMLLYYGILMVSVLMFSLQFLFNGKYAYHCGNSTAATFTFSLLSSVSGLLCLLAVNRFSLSATPFTLLAAGFAAINSILFALCSLKALSRISLSLFSLYSMLGGMLLPFLSGLLFYQESLTAGKIICIGMIAVSLFLTTEKDSRKGGLLYCWGAFVFNGLSGVLSKFFESAQFEKASSADYSIWIAIITAGISGFILLTMGRKIRGLTFRAASYALGYGIINRTANYLLLIALTVLPASVQYPFITGGVMAVTTVISSLTGQRPTRNELIALVLSLIGVITLVIL